MKTLLTNPFGGMGANFLKIALRNLSKNKVFSMINIAGLAIGLTAAMLILLYAKDEVSYDKFHTKNPNIYRITSAWMKPDGSLGHKDGNTGDLQGPEFKEKIPEIAAFVRVQSESKDISKAGEIILKTPSGKIFTLFYDKKTWEASIDFPSTEGMEYVSFKTKWDNKPVKRIILSC